MGQEGDLHRRRKGYGRRAENHKPARLRQIGREFERQMAPEAPTDQPRVREVQRLDRRAQRPRLGFERIEGRVARVVRGAVTGQIDRDQPEALAERSVELLGKGARGRRIAVDEHRRRPPPRQLVRRDATVRRFDCLCLHGPALLIGREASLAPVAYARKAHEPRRERFARFRFIFINCVRCLFSKLPCSAK